MANAWTKNDYNRTYGDDDDRRERQYRQRDDGLRGARFRDERQFGGRFEEEYGYGTPSSYEYRRMYGDTGMDRDMDRDMDQDRDRDRDARFRDVARFERESNYGGDRDQEWQPHRGSSRRSLHEHDMQHGDYPRSRAYEREVDRETDRGAWNRSRDEVSSWFGDDDARRRRHMDEMRDDMRHERDEDRRDYRARRYVRYA